MKLTDTQKAFIRMNCENMNVRSLAEKLNRSFESVRGYINYNGLKAKPADIEEGEQGPVYEIWISGKFHTEIECPPDQSDFKNLSDIRESHGELLIDKTFQIFKRVRAKFPVEVEEKAPFQLRSVPAGYTEIGENAFRMAK